MEYILQGVRTAWELVAGLDPEIYGILGRSLRLAFTATVLGTLVGVPVGFLVGSRAFRGKSFVVTALNSLMAVPTVIIGLLGYAFFSHRAPMGSLDLLFTPTLIIVGEFFLALPLITSFTVSAVHSVDPSAVLTARALGAGRLQTALTILMEARYGVLAAIIAGFGRAISEVGAAMMLGGNIRFYTRTMTTAIALEVSKGEFGFGLALGFFLLVVVFSMNIVFRALQGRGRLA